MNECGSETFKVGRCKTKISTNMIKHQDGNLAEGCKCHVRTLEYF